MVTYILPKILPWIFILFRCPTSFYNRRKENEKQSEKENDRILRRLSRAQLLDLLIEQSREKEALEKRVEELEAELASRRIDVEEAGNLAKAALKLNHIFEDAQKAADQYLLNIREKEKILDEKLREAKKEEE